MKCTDCKYLDIRCFAGGVSKWICGKNGSISYDDLPRDVTCKLPDGPPAQEIPEPADEYLKPVFQAAVESYKKIWPRLAGTMNRENDYQGDPDLSGIISKLENMLMRTFELSWYDIIYLRRSS